MARRQAHDGLTNVITGLNGADSKRAGYNWQPGLLNNYQQIEACYQDDWLARAIVDVTAEDMTREWRRIKCQEAEDIERVEKEFGVKHLVQEAEQWARLYGGAGIVMITDQDLTEPLRLDQLKPGSLKKLMVFDRWDLTAQQINTWDVLSDSYLLPEHYTLRNGKTNIHHSHVVRFVGEKLPLRWMQQTQGWGDSVLRKCLFDIADMVAAKDGIAELMQEANVDVVTREGLSDDLASDQEDAIIERYRLFRQMKSVIHTAILDGEEQYDRKTLNLSGVAPIIELFMTWISGAAKTPVTKLFGTSAKGLNATGEGDLRTYYDTIKALQSSKFTQPLYQLDQVLARTAIGRMPDDFAYEWNPLAQPSTVEVAQAEQARAETDAKYYELGVVTKSQIQRNLQSNDRYQFDDEQIAELEELESANMFEELPDLNVEQENGA